MVGSPVYYAFVQAKFNPIAMMSKYIGNIQDILRKSGYTLFEQERERWLISKSNRTAGFIINNASIAYHTTHYINHTDFFSPFSEGLQAVHETVGLDHFTRFGLRYLNAVIPNTKEQIAQYFSDELQGARLHQTFVKRTSEFIFETMTKPIIKKGILVVRVHHFKSPLGFPSDLFPFGLCSAQRFCMTSDIEHAVIDIDHFVEQHAIPVDLEQVGKQLISLHDETKKAFDGIVTPYAKKIWFGESNVTGEHQ